MRPRKLPLSLSLSMPGDVHECVGARWRLAPRPSHPVPCVPGGQAECFLRVAEGAPSLSPGPQLLCLVGWSPGSYWKAQGHWREGWGRSSSGCLARLPFPPLPLPPLSLSGSSAGAASRIRHPVPNRRLRTSMTSSAPSAIGWAAPAGRTLSPVARKLTLP